MTEAEYRKLLPHASDDFIRRNATPEMRKIEAVADFVAPQKKRLRQKSGPKLNTTEAAFLEHLRGNSPGTQIYAQTVTLSIANGCRYTPDAFAFACDDGEHYAQAWEVKGFMREDAAVKIKVAAAFYPLIRFRLVTKRKKRDGAGWAIEDVLP